MSGTNTGGYKETTLSADGALAQRWSFLPADDRREMLPIEEVAILLDVSVSLLKRQHLADPKGYPADRVGTLWRMPCWWVERKIACKKDGAP